MSNESIKPTQAEVTTLLLNQMLNFEPQLCNQFLVDLPGLSSVYVEAVELPQFSPINSVFDNSNWTTFNLTLREDIKGTVTELLQEWSRAYTDPQSTISATKNIELHLLGPTGFTIRTWKFTDCLLAGIEWGKLSYQTTDLQRIRVAIKPEYCEHTLTKSEVEATTP